MLKTSLKYAVGLCCGFLGMATVTADEMVSIEMSLGWGDKRLNPICQYIDHDYMTGGIDCSLGSLHGPNNYNLPYTKVRLSGTVPQITRWLENDSPFSTNWDTIDFSNDFSSTGCGAVDPVEGCACVVDRFGRPQIICEDDFMNYGAERTPIPKPEPDYRPYLLPLPDSRLIIGTDFGQITNKLADWEFTPFRLPGRNGTVWGHKGLNTFSKVMFETMVA